MKKCLRCSFYGREPKETGKLINGVPICVDCMLQDAKDNRGIVIDYSGLKQVEEKISHGKDTGRLSKRTRRKKSI